MVEAVLIAGTDTTRNQLGCTMALFAEHPEQWAAAGRAPRAGRRARSRSRCATWGPSVARPASPRRTSSTATSCSRRARWCNLSFVGVEHRSGGVGRARTASTSPARPAHRS